MPVAEAIAKAQLARFADYKEFPETEPGLRDLLRAFSAAQSERQCEELGDWLVAKRHICPKPADVYEVLDVMAESSTQCVDWVAPRQPGDEPFGGVADLIDERVLEILRTRVKRGATHSERKAAEQFLRLRHLRGREASA